MTLPCFNKMLETSRAIVEPRRTVVSDALNVPASHRPFHLDNGHVGVSYRSVATNEDGLVSWATLVVVVCFVTVLALVANVGRISNHKLEAQNAADAAALSASLVQARSMNAITASNHMIGELTTLYTMHHAFGGDALDERESYSTGVSQGLSFGLRGIHLASTVSYGFGAIFYWAFPGVPVGIPNPPEGYGPAADTPRGEASIYDAKCLLKYKLIIQYVKHINGTIKIGSGVPLTWSIWPPTVAKGFKRIRDGHKMRREANAEIRALVKEYKFINRLESFAIGAKRIKKFVLLPLIDSLWGYERYLVGDLIPTLGAAKQSMAAARFVANEHGCVGEILGRPSLTNMALSQLGMSSASLPVVQDPSTRVERTQLMRAMYPWMQEWRSPLLTGFDLLAPRSRVSRFYEYHTDQYSKRISNRFRNERGIRLYVLEQVNGANRNTDKGREAWRLSSESSQADELFCVVGVARKQVPPKHSYRHVLPNTSPTPIAAVAQAMIYNANSPKTWRRRDLDWISWLLDRKAQPTHAWDTLNWTEGATEWKGGKKYFNVLPKSMHWTLGAIEVLDIPYPPDIKLPFEVGPPTPRVKLNWQTHLTPIAPRNLAKRAVMTQDGRMRDRMINDVMPAVLGQELGAPLFNH